MYNVQNSLCAPGKDSGGDGTGASSCFLGVLLIIWFFNLLDDHFKQASLVSVADSRISVL